MKRLSLILIVLISSALTAAAQTDWAGLSRDELRANSLIGYDCVTVETPDIDENADYLDGTVIKN